MQYANGNSIMT